MAESVENDKHWYALYAQCRHECKVEKQLAEKGIETYLPMKRTLRQWSDRKKWVMAPLFNGYLFFRGGVAECYHAVRSYGAVRVVGFNHQPAVVRDLEIETIRKVLDEIPYAESGPFYQVGDRVEVIHGPLSGLKGRLDSCQGEHRFSLTVDSIKQAIRFSINRRDVKKI